MTAWLIRDALTLLAALNENLVCRHASRGWRERLGVVSVEDELALPLCELFALDAHPGLPDQLTQLLHDGGPLHDVPMYLKGESEITQGLLSAWRAQPEDRQPWLLLAVTCNVEFDQALDELRQLRTTHQLILDAACEGI